MYIYIYVDIYIYTHIFYLHCHIYNTQEEPAHEDSVAQINIKPQSLVEAAQWAKVALQEVVNFCKQHSLKTSVLFSERVTTSSHCVS